MFQYQLTCDSETRYVSTKKRRETMSEYRLTCDYGWQEPYLGRGVTVIGNDFTGDTAEYFFAKNDKEAQKIAAKAIGKYRWTKWRKEGNGYERYRTAKDWQAGWMRLERLDD